MWPGQHPFKRIAVIGYAATLRTKMTDIDLLSIIDDSFPIKTVSFRQRAAVIAQSGSGRKVHKITTAVKTGIFIVITFEGGDIPRFVGAVVLKSAKQFTSIMMTSR